MQFFCSLKLDLKWLTNNKLEVAEKQGQNIDERKAEKEGYGWKTVQN